VKESNIFSSFSSSPKKEAHRKKNEHLEIGKIDRNLKGGSDIISETFYRSIGDTKDGED